MNSGSPLFYIEEKEMEPTIKEFMIIFPEFACADSTRLEFFFDTAKGRVNAAIFCEDTSHHMAVYLVTAHSLTIMNPENAGGGKVSAEKVGDVAISYQSTGDGEGEFSSTQYGLQYLRLLKENVITANVL